MRDMDFGYSIFDTLNSVWYGDYHDAAKGQCTYPLNRFDLIRGLAVGRIIRYPLLTNDQGRFISQGKIRGRKETGAWRGKIQ
jgi:hypothetical protein